MKAISKVGLGLLAFSLCGLCMAGFIFWSLNSSLNQIPDNEIWRITSLGQTSYLTTTNDKVLLQSKNSPDEWDCLCVYAVDKATGKILWSTEELAKPYIAEYKKLYPDSSRIPGLVEIIGNDSKNRIVFVTLNYFLFALDENNGQSIWGPIGISSYSFAEAASSNIVFITSDAGNLMALDTISGIVLWESETIKTSPEFYSRIFFHNSVVYTDIDDENKNYLFAFDSHSGETLWRIELEPRAYYPIFDAENLYMIRHSNSETKNGEIFVVDTETGDKSWNAIFPDDYSYEPSHPQINGNQLYVVQEARNNDKKVSKLVVRDTLSGKVLWEFNQSYSEGEVIYYIQDNVVFVGSETGYIFALDTTTGQEIWKVQTQSFPTCMTIFSDMLLVDAENTYLAAFNPQTGTQKWLQSIPVDSNRYFSECFGDESSVRMYDKKIFVVDDNRKLRALDIETGQEIWSWQDFRYPDWRPIPIYKPTPEIAMIEDSVIYVFNSWTIANGVFALKIQ